MGTLLFSSGSKGAESNVVNGDIAAVDYIHLINSNTHYTSFKSQSRKYLSQY